MTTSPLSILSGLTIDVANSKTSLAISATSSQEVAEIGNFKVEIDGGGCMSEGLSGIVNVS